jgi:hypothetical protein
VFLVNSGDKLFGSDAGIPGAYHNTGAVGVVCTKIITLVTIHYVKAYPDIRLDIFKQVAKVNGAVCVRQS